MWPEAAVAKRGNVRQYVAGTRASRARVVIA